MSSLFEGSSPSSRGDQCFEADLEWQSLRAEIEQSVELVNSQIELGGVALSWLRVGNPEVLLELAVSGDQAKSEAEMDPFWAATWRAALGLDQFLAGVLMPGVRVLELGCGSGQAGTAAAIRGAQVVSTDSVELALKVARLNSWGYRHRIRFEPLIWASQTVDEPKFPVIIGSDLVYDPNLFESLEICVRQHLKAEGRLYLSEPHRHTGDKFSSWIVQAGWNSVEHDMDLDDGRVPVRVFECWLD